MIYSYNGNNGREALTLIFLEQDPVTVSSTHPAWAELNDLRVRNELGSKSEQEVLSVLNHHITVNDWQVRLSDRVDVTPYGVVIDGEISSGTSGESISKIIGTADASDEYLLSMARFFEKTSDNPSMINSDGLFRWMSAEKLTLSSDGDFIGYKFGDKLCKDSLDYYARHGDNQVVTFANGDTQRLREALEELLVEHPDGVYMSTFSGGGIVNGVSFPTYVPNYVGAVVEMPRDSVDANGKVECSVGLHVGTFKYAYDFGGRHRPLMLVKVDPRDVVSVPDYDFSKLRSCRYTVIADGITDILDSHSYFEEQFCPIVVEDEIKEIFETDKPKFMDKVKGLISRIMGNS